MVKPSRNRASRSEAGDWQAVVGQEAGGVLGGVVLDLVEGGERGLNAAGCFIGERGQVCCRAGSLDEDLGAGVPAGPGGPDGRRDADGGDELPVAVAADGAEPGVLDAGLRPARV
jgi:hypothetical protein